MKRFRLPQAGAVADQNRGQKSIEASFHADWLARGRIPAAWQGNPWGLSLPGRRPLAWCQNLCLVPASRAHHNGPARPVCPLQASKSAAQHTQSSAIYYPVL